MKNNKTAKGIVSFVTIIIILSLILASTIVYQNNITANAVKEISIDAESIPISVKEVANVDELNQLNEGWYQITNGYVYYLESFDSYVFLYIKIRNPDEQNGLLVVDADGNIKFDETFRGLPGKQVVYDEKKDENAEIKEIFEKIRQ